MRTAKTTHPETKVDKEDVKSLRGTLMSVGFVGAVIVVMWVAIFMLYMSRV